MPRSWISMRGPGAMRIGRSWSDKELRRPPKVNPDAVLAICKRQDGGLMLAIPDQNGPAEHTPGLVPVMCFFFARVDHAIEVRTGTLQRMGARVGADSWISDRSAGQIAAAIRAEARALGLDPRWARVRIVPGEPEPSGWAESPQSKLLWFLGLTALMVGGLIWLGS